MAQLLTDSNLNAELENLMRSAKKELVLISPYIKLHERIKSILKSKKEQVDLSIIIVFGKNEDNISKSVNKSDIDFLKTFPNVELKYEKRLHAKYYLNDEFAIATSMNLYDYSQNNNIEFGIITARDGVLKFMKRTFSDSASLDEQIYWHIHDIVDGSISLFHKTPNFEKSKIPFKKDKYLGSTIIVDETDSIFSQKKQYKPKPETKPPHGYCIRTGVEIPFNPKKPMTLEAYKSWERYKNPDYKEKYCHKTGKSSYGKTSMSSPIL